MAISPFPFKRFSFWISAMGNHPAATHRNRPYLDAAQGTARSGRPGSSTVAAHRRKSGIRPPLPMVCFDLELVQWFWRLGAIPPFAAVEAIGFDSAMRHLAFPMAGKQTTPFQPFPFLRMTPPRNRIALSEENSANSDALNRPILVWHGCLGSEFGKELLANFPSQLFKAK